MKKGILLLLMGFSTIFAEKIDRPFSASYEILEMSVNNFKYFSGDLGYQLDKNTKLRLAIMEVKLSERHLADDVWAQIVTGNNITGYMRGYELNIDYFAWKGLYFMANTGVIHMAFEHTQTKESYSNTTFALGSGFGYKYNLPFADERIYLNLSIPIRYFFNPVRETRLGTSTVNEITLAPSIWLFVGVEF